MTPHSQQQQQHPPTSRTDADIIFEDHTATMVTAPTKNIFAVSFNTRQLGLDVECGGDDNNNNDNNDVIVAVTRVKIEEYKNKIHPGDIIISVGRIQLKNNRNIKSIDDVLTLISSTTERPLILEFARYRKPIRKQQIDHAVVELKKIDSGIDIFAELDDYEAKQQQQHLQESKEGGEKQNRFVVGSSLSNSLRGLLSSSSGNKVNNNNGIAKKLLLPPAPNFPIPNHIFNNDDDDTLPSRDSTVTTTSGNDNDNNAKHYNGTCTFYSFMSCVCVCASFQQQLVSILPVPPFLRVSYQAE